MTYRRDQDPTMASADHSDIELAGHERLDEVRSLWIQLQVHHRAVVLALPQVADDEQSWRRRRKLYLDRPTQALLAISA